MQNNRAFEYLKLMRTIEGMDLKDRQPHIQKAIAMAKLLKKQYGITRDMVKPDTWQLLNS